MGRRHTGSISDCVVGEEEFGGGGAGVGEGEVVVAAEGEDDGILGGFGFVATGGVEGFAVEQEDVTRLEFDRDLLSDQGLVFGEIGA